MSTYTPPRDEAEKVERRLARYAEVIRLVDEGRARPAVVEVVELLREGLNGLEIAERLGLAKSTVYQRLNDPTDEKAAERKSRTYGFCRDCGTRVSNSGSLDLPERCAKCARAQSTQRAKAYVIDAIQDWHRRYGKQPGAADWNLGPSQQDRLHPERQEQIRQAHRERHWPKTAGVQVLFGSWSAAIEAAGLTPIPTGKRIDPETWRNHMKGHRMKPLTAVEILQREAEKNERRREALKEEVAALETEHRNLLAAKASLNGGTKAGR